MTRIAGNNRYETAALASRAAYPNGAPVCYVVSGETFPDALAAGSFNDGPILLTQSTRLPKPTADEVRRLRVKRVVVLGGTAAVSQSVVEELDRLVV